MHWIDPTHPPKLCSAHADPLPRRADEAAGCGHPLPQPADPPEAATLTVLELTTEIAADNVRRLRRPAQSIFDRRWATAWYADLQTTGRPLPCWVEDVSADGAKLRVGFVPTAFVVGGSLSLVLPNVDVIAARIAWQHRDRVGVQFCGSEPWLVELALRATGAESWFPTTTH